MLSPKDQIATPSPSDDDDDFVDVERPSLGAVIGDLACIAFAVCVALACAWWLAR